MSFGDTWGSLFGGHEGGPSDPLAPRIPAPTITAIGRFAYVGDVIDRGLARLIKQFHGRPRIETYLAVLLSEVQELQNAAWQVLFALDLATARGASLDLLGKIVKRPRDGYDDDVYRLLLKVEILVLRSKGRPEDLLAILALLLGSSAFTYRDEIDGLPATADIDAVGIALPFSAALFARTLRRAKPAGVKLWLYYSIVADPHVFRFGAVEGDTSTTSGFADSYTTPTTGGRLAGVITTKGT